MGDVTVDLSPLPPYDPPYAGDPREDDFPEYVTHWTPLPVVQEPDTKETP